jgi:type I restriction enzyme S subunit
MAGEAPDTDLIDLPFDVRADWRAPRMSRHCQFVRDGDWIESKDQGGADYRLLQISNIGVGQFVETGNFRWITDETFRRLNCTEVLIGDVLVARMPDPTGRSWYVSELPWRAVTAVDVAIIRTKKEELDPRFLAYFLNSPACLGLVHSLTTGTTRMRIRRSDIERLQVPLPSPEEQRAIAHILGTLDAKIELNRRMNETLEAMARALFKSWFVDFDPVRAKAEGRNPGLPEHLADLFPESFEDSELGEIPEGWDLKAIGDLADVIGGGTPSTKEPSYWEGGTLHWATPKDLSGLSVPVLLDTERCITAKGLSQVSSGLLPTGTVLLSSRAPIGYLAVTEIPVAINQGFIAMMPKKDVSNLFLLLWASDAHEEIVSRANGSTFLEISKTNFRPIPVVAPGGNIMRTFDTEVRPLFGHIVENERESHTLAALRDTLLPKLISGELRVAGAEAFLKEREIRQ